MQLNQQPNSGKRVEAAVKAAYNIGEKVAIDVDGRIRIPDGVTDEVISEVKNVQSLSFTSQLRDYANYAASRGISFDLYVRPTTQLSGPLTEAIQQGRIFLKFIP